MRRPPPRSTLFPYTALSRSKITADRLVLAAGTLGSTFLMLKNRKAFPGLSSRLGTRLDRKSTRLNSSHANISYAVFCLKKNTDLCVVNTHDHESCDPGAALP